jgi:hypothetical protein
VSVYTKLTTTDLANLLHEGKSWYAYGFTETERDAQAEQLNFLVSCWICQNGGGCCDTIECEQVLKLQGGTAPSVKWYKTELTKFLKEKREEHARNSSK